MTAKWVVVSSRSELDEVMKQDRLLVGFGAAWCDQSRTLEKHLEALSRESEVMIVWVDPTQIEGVTRDYGVNCVPMILEVEGGKVRERHAGRPTASQLHHMLERERPQQLCDYASNGYL